jgi:hypothetical protein
MLFFACAGEKCAKILTSAAERSLPPRGGAKSACSPAWTARTQGCVSVCRTAAAAAGAGEASQEREERPLASGVPLLCHAAYSLLSPCFASFSQVDEPSYVHAARRLNSLSANHFALLSQHAKCTARRNEQEGEILSLFGRVSFSISHFGALFTLRTGQQLNFEEIWF